MATFSNLNLKLSLGGMTVIQAHVYFPAKDDRAWIRWTVRFLPWFPSREGIKEEVGLGGPHVVSFSLTG